MWGLWGQRISDAVVRCPRVVSHNGRDLRHGLDTDDALEGKVGLVRERTREGVRTELVRRLECVGDEVLGPLIEETVLQEEGEFKPGESMNPSNMAYVCGNQRLVVGLLSVTQGHDEHIATL